jgi:probable F420-dependent oxidoreductase
MDSDTARPPGTSDIGAVGIWTWTLDPRPITEVTALARLVEQLGYGALWFKEDFGREALTTAALLLSATDELTIANGVASMYGRDATAMRSAQQALAEAFPGRHVLGVGVSHRPHVEARGHVYRAPAATATEYLTAMRAASFISPAPEAPSLTLLAALGPRMLQVAAAYANGAHTFGITPAHTEAAREALGADAFLAPVQPVVIDDDRARGRATARAYVGLLLNLEHYRTAWRRLGFGEDDFDDGGSGRLVEALVAIGDEDAAAERVRQHLAAGADHVAVQVIPPDLATPPADAWRRFADAAADITRSARAHRSKVTL